MGDVTVNVRVANTDTDPVLYDTSYLVQLLKPKFIPPVNCKSFITQNGNLQVAYRVQH